MNIVIMNLNLPVGSREINQDLEDDFGPEVDFMKADCWSKIQQNNI